MTTVCKTILFVLFLLAACSSESTTATPSGSPQKTQHFTPSQTEDNTAITATEAAPPAPAIEACVRGDSLEAIESGDQIRQYLLHVPAGYEPGTPAALVLVFHGAGIGAERFVEYSRFSSVAGREGFLLVYPQGLGEEPAWNPSPGSRDVQFVSDLIDHLQTRCSVDPERVYASGHSNGGGMVHRLGCDLADRIAAIGPVSGAYSGGTCSPSRPVPVFAIHGTTDPIVSYEGIPTWAAAWAERNGCDPEPVDVPHNVIISEKQWRNCPQGGEVTLYTITDLGHDWPSDLIDVGQTIWDFFEQHPLSRDTP